MHRLRYARRELGKILSALEAVQAPEFDAALEVADLRERLRQLEAKQPAERKQAYNEGFRDGRNEWSELTARWRHSYESMKDIVVAGSGPNPDVDRLDQIIRGWVGKA